jgi:hypothetical protein
VSGKGQRLAIARKAQGLTVLAAAFAMAAPSGAYSQSVAKLEAQYTASLAGLPVGKGNWTIDIGDNQYTAAASGVTTGFIKWLTSGRATGATHGTLGTNGQVLTSDYAATIHTGKKDDEVRVSVSGGTVKEFKAEPPSDENPERIPVTEAHRKGVTDPMTATLVRVAGTGDTRTPETCDRQFAVFDGRLRYDLKLSFKRMENVQAKKGYGGQAVVCAVQFVPIAGFIPSRYTVKYVAQAKDIEIWFAPISGTRIMAPYRAQLDTPLGMGVIEANQFVTTSGAAAAARPAAKGPKTQ